MAQAEGGSQLLPLIVVVGPTASGKTRLALHLAEQLGGDLVGADARQVYARLDIGTGKATPAELDGIAHHLLSVADPSASFSVHDYAALAHQAIDGVIARGRLPLLVGGTGLYIRAVVDAFEPPQVPPQPELRARLERQWRQEGPATVQAQLAALDHVAYSTIDLHNSRRVIRAIEVSLVSGRPFSEQRRAGATRYHPLIIGLRASREHLQHLARERIEEMVRKGFLGEVRQLLHNGYDFTLPAFSAVGYRELAGVVTGELSLDEALCRIERATFAYQKRQMTWFQADDRIQWFDVAEVESMVRAITLASEWLQAFATAPR